MSVDNGDEDTPVYSICITHYNQSETLGTSLESILSQSLPRTEVVIVDAGSDDGSLEIIQEFTDRYDRLRCVVEPGCNRGEGRQLALEAAEGAHIISNYDLDQSYGDILAGVLDVYRSLLDAEGNIALRTAGNLFIAPRDLLFSIGGYEPLMRGEDHELTDRLEDRGVLRYLPVKNTQNVSDQNRSAIRRAQRAFRASKALYRIGFDPEQIFRFLYSEHSFPLALAGTPVYVSGILAGVFDGRVYSAREKNWREIIEMSARPTYSQIVVDVPEELKSYEVEH
jgi:glycosyltransferase involved in cell wall biosynthesis